jgi:nicotinamide-nucleotide amidase
MAESCTGGLIAHKMTDVPGSSDYFLFSAVTYSNEAKMRVLGVSQETLKAHGAVSEETAREMAEGARKVAGATHAISTTGIAGPEGGTPEKPVGTVCIGIAGPDGVKAKRFVLSYPSRQMNKTMFAVTALNRLRRVLE